MAEKRVTSRFILKGDNRSARAFAMARKQLSRLSRSVALYGTAAAAAIALVVRSNAKQIDSLAKTADALGITTENLQTLRTMAELTGVETGKFDKALAKMQKTIGEVARRGGDMALAITDMGLSVEEVMSLPADEQFEVVAKALAGITNESVRASIANDLFGRDAQRLLKLTNQLANEGLGPMRKELEDMGVLISRTEAAGVERMNDSILLAKEAASALAQRYTIELAPGIAAIAEEFTEAAKETGGFKDAAFNAAEGTIRAFAFVIDSIDGIGDGFEKMANRGIIAFERLVQQAPKLPFTLPIAAVNKTFRDNLQEELRFSEQVIAQALARIAEIEEEADPSEAILARLAKVRAELAEATGGSAGETPADGGVFVTPEEQQRIDKVKSTLDGLFQQVREFGLGAEDKALLKLVDLGASEEDLAQAMHLTAELKLQASEEEARIQAKEQQKNLEEEVLRITESLRTPTEAHVAAVNRVAELYDLGIIPSAEEYAELINRMTARFDEANEKASEMDQFAIQAARNMQTALADFLFDPFDEGVEGMLKSFSKAIQRMAAEAAAAAIFKKLFGEEDGEAGLLSSLFKGSGSGDGSGGFASFLGNLFGGGKAAGGPVSAGRPYLVGERGPEIVVPKISGEVIPNDRIGGGPTQISIGVTGQVTSQTARQIARETDNRLREARARA